MPTKARQEASPNSLKPKSVHRPRRAPTKPITISQKTSRAQKTAVAREAASKFNYQEINNLAAAEPVDYQAPIKIPDQDAVYWRWLAWFGIGIIAILLTSSLVVFLNFNNYSLQTADISYRAPKKLKPVEQFTAVAPLTGLATTTANAERRPWAVVIENFPTVRPQAGLNSADLVIESPTEGGITRFVTVFQSELPPGLVGPIRSARSFFNDWIRPLAPFFSHSGGSEKALSQLQKGYGGIQDVNEFFNADAYTRDDSKKPPHNLFTTAKRFWGYAADKNWSQTGTAPKLNFNKDLPAGKPVLNITIPYQPSEYQVVYNYQPVTDTYARTTGGTTQFDSATNTAPAIKNVIVLFTKITPYPNDALKRVDIQTTGSGQLLLFANGQMYQGQWTKTDNDSFFDWQDSSGQPLILNPGKIWISVIDNAQASSIVTNNAQ